MFDKVCLHLEKQSSKNKIKKKEILRASNLLISERKPKTPSFYQKIYSITPDSLNESKTDNNKNNKNSKKKSVSLKNIFKKPKFLITPFQFKTITNPKLPFSKRTIESKEIKKNKIKLKKPSKIFHTFETIQWLRKKFSENIKNKSIYSLLPNNGKPVIPENESEEDKRHRKMMEYLQSLKEPIGREKYVNINPKYFFNTTAFETVLKLKKIFLEFDADGNRRMELDEMLEMFESNKISANINDLVTLFFRGKKFKKKEILKLYLNFYQFMYFALTREQDFRQFMRNIKERAEKERIKKAKNKIGITDIKKEEDQVGIKDSKIKEDEEEKDGYLPMSFKSLLDYFIDKGKERKSKEVINKAIEEMNQIINKNNKNSLKNTLKKLNTQKTLKLYENDPKKPLTLSKKRTFVSQKTLQPFIKSLVKDSKSLNKSYSRRRNNLEDEFENLNYELNIDDGLDIIDYDKQFEEINFQKLIGEFSNLFNINNIISNNQNKNINYNINNNINNIKSQSHKIAETNNQNKLSKIESENKLGKAIKKSYSQSLLNSLSTRSQENMKNNLIYSAKGDYTNTFYHPYKLENSRRKVFKVFRKNKLLSAQVENYYKNNVKENDEIRHFNFDNDNSRNKTNFVNNKNIRDRNFQFIKTKDSNFKNQNEFPQVNNYYKKIKNKNKSVDSLDEYSEKNKKKIFNKFRSATHFIREKIKYNFINNGLTNKSKKDKYYINYYGGKINLIKKNNSFFSNLKLDYVPLKLLSIPNGKSKNIYFNKK